MTRNVTASLAAIGDGFQFQHRNSPALPIQDSPIHSERTLVYKQP
jgi:hypothetical protein